MSTQGDSPLRSLIAAAQGTDYRSFDSLSAARLDPDGVVILEGDDGGQIYVVARAIDVACSENTLAELLCDIDVREWPGNDSGSARVCFEQQPIGSGVAGGMGGGVVSDGVWVHPRLRALEEAICEVLRGKRAHLAARSHP
jgi:hypothetical protein